MSRPAAPPSQAPVPAGPRWYRSRIRAFGPIAGLAPMAVLGGLALLLRALGNNTVTGLGSLVAGTSAAPGLLIAGVPFAPSTNYPIAIAASVPFWLVLGLIASRRVTARPIASWREYRRELVFLTIAVIVGAILALGIAAAIVGRSLLT